MLKERSSAKTLSSVLPFHSNEFRRVSAEFGLVLLGGRISKAFLSAV